MHKIDKLQKIYKYQEIRNYSDIMVCIFACLLKNARMKPYKQTNFYQKQIVNIAYLRNFQLLPF